MPRRRKMFQVPEGLMVMSWYRLRYIEILCGPKVVALPQVDDLADHLGPGGSRAVVRSP